MADCGFHLSFTQRLSKHKKMHHSYKPQLVIRTKSV